MQNKNFEQSVKDLLYDHMEAAPDLMGKVFEKRTPLYIFKNKLILNKYKLLAASLIIGLLVGYFGINSNTVSNQSELVTTSTNVDQKASTNSSNTGQASNDKIQDDVKPKSSPVLDDGKVAANDVTSEIENAKIVTSQKTTSPIQVISSTTEDRAKTGQPIVKTIVTSNPQPKGDEEDSKPKIVVEDKKKEQTKTTISKEEVVATETDEVSKNNEKGKEPVVAVSENSNADKDGSLGDDSDAGNDDQDGGFDKVVVKPSKWAVIVSGGPSMGSRMFGKPGSLSNTERGLVTVRDNTETQMVSLMTEISLNLRLSNNVEAFSGISLFNRKEKMAFTNSTYEVWNDITETKVIEYHPVFGEREISIYDTTAREKEIVTTGNSVNNYRHLTIPLGLRYSFYHPKYAKWSGYVSGQIGFEVNTLSKGEILDHNYQVISLGNGFDRSTVGMSGGLGLGLTYMASRRLSVLAEPRAIYYLSPTNKDSYNLNQNDYGYGLLLGLKFSL